jgi:hydroxyacylglutathione hydrolase
VIHTPGHTPEHISFLLTDTAASTKPIMFFSGDFVFVGDIGRPDLLEEAAGFVGTREISAKQMFSSLKKFKSLPDYIQVWPAHGAGSACGKSLGAVPSTTVGYEKLVNWAMNIESEEEFVKTLLEGQPEPPKYFGMMKKLNKVGPQILGGVPHPGRLTFPQFNEAIKNGLKIVDTRNKLSFAGGHVPGSINIQDNSSFSTWAGWILNYKDPFVLIAADNRIEEITKALLRIGLDNVYGYVNDMDAWSNAGHELHIVKQLSCCELKNLIDSAEKDFEIIDVRGKSEYQAGHIENARNIHVGYLIENLDKLSKEKQYVLNCASGDRSSLAASILVGNGYKNVYNLTGGYNTWLRDYPTCKEPIKELEELEV